LILRLAPGGLSDDADQLQLFPVRSRVGGGRERTEGARIETVRDEIAKLKQLRAPGLI
jgi:hypothetical protein